MVESNWPIQSAKKDSMAQVGETNVTVAWILPSQCEEAFEARSDSPFLKYHPSFRVKKGVQGQRLKQGDKVRAS